MGDAGGGGVGVAGGHPRRQRLTQQLHLPQRPAAGRHAAAVLAAPARHLAGVVARGGAVVGQAHLPGAHAVQGGQGVGLGGVHVGPLPGVEPRQGGVVEDAAGHVLHEVEGRPQDRGVLAEEHRAGDGHGGGAQSAQHAELALHGVRRGQRGRRRLLAQHVGVVARLRTEKGRAGRRGEVGGGRAGVWEAAARSRSHLHKVGGVGLAMGKLADAHVVALEAGHVALQVAAQRILRDHGWTI